MKRIIEESIQDIDAYLTSSEIKDKLVEEYPNLRDDPSLDEADINEYVVELVGKSFPDESLQPSIVFSEVVKVLGSETETIATGHPVVRYNGQLYDYTASQFNDSYNDLITFDKLPVTQRVISSPSQVNQGVSSVKSYALIVE